MEQEPEILHEDRLIQPDVIVRDKAGKFWIVDFKTTARTPDGQQVGHLNEVQLSCYAVLYREATGHPESGLELHHLVKTKQPKLVVTPLSPMTPDQGRRLMAMMTSLTTTSMGHS